MKTIKILLLSAVIIFLAGCTQNNGHIGPLFGSWHLETMTRNGDVYSQPDGTDTFWNFQGQMLMVILSEGMYEKYDFDGTWERTDGYLMLDFTHSCNTDGPGTGDYRAPYWMGFPENAVLLHSVQKLDGSDMILGWTSAEGEVYIYKFKKTW